MFDVNSVLKCKIWSYREKLDWTAHPRTPGASRGALTGTAHHQISVGEGLGHVPWRRNSSRCDGCEVLSRRKTVYDWLFSNVRVTLEFDKIYIIILFIYQQTCSRYQTTFHRKFCQIYHFCQNEAEDEKFTYLKFQVWIFVIVPHR